MAFETACHNNPKWGGLHLHKSSYRLSYNWSSSCRNRCTISGCFAKDSKGKIKKGNYITVRLLKTWNKSYRRPRMLQSLISLASKRSLVVEIVLKTKSVWCYKPSYSKECSTSCRVRVLPSVICLPSASISTNCSTIWYNGIESRYRGM